MRTLSLDSYEDWLKRNDIIISTTHKLCYLEQSSWKFRIPLPEIGLEIIALTHVLINVIEEDKSGLFLWLKDFDIWSPDTEKIGISMYQSMLPPQTNIYEHPILSIESVEVTEQKALSIITMLFQWDLYLVPENAKYIIFFSHDGYIQIESRTLSEHHRMLTSLHHWHPDWGPQ